MKEYNKANIPLAKTLRKNMTMEEKHLWYDFLKKLPVTVKRQHIIGNFIVDFYIACKKIVIEIDGAQHTLDANLFEDFLRDNELNKWGIKVIRYFNADIKTNFNGVCSDILNKLGLTFSDLKQN